MRTASLFDLLPDFGAHLARPGPSAAAPQPAGKAEPRIDVDALVAEAVAAAETALAARLEADHEAALAAQRQADAEATAAFMASLGQDMGDAVAAGISAMETRLGAAMEETVARILGGVLGDDLRARSIEALARAIAEAVGDAEAVSVRISGPLSLFEPLRAALGPRADQLRFTEAPGFDLTASIDEAVFETRLSEWSAALSQVLS